ncbi:Fur family transcriptional regulator [uncultured Jatrophihabitans sp.]|uniref:Fur family transcriptional regulator n=1 Tax=uncultured Jatrophihabitans sp. TaxID=1610747 RepID=UPI0035CBC6D9
MKATRAHADAAVRTEPAAAPAQSHAAGRQRNTRQAQAIETALAGADGFRTAHDLFTDIRAGGERIGLTTVYRHLALLADTDRADVVHTAEGEAQYRLCGPRDTSNPDGHHHHIVCRLCGRSVEVSGPEVEAWADRVAAAAGFTDITHTVELFGLCPQHSPNPPRSAPPRSTTGKARR